VQAVTNACLRSEVDHTVESVLGEAGFDGACITARQQ
jgi:hypothetical protein